MSDATPRRTRPRNPFLSPAVAVMNRLKYPQKFLLISLLFAAALGLVMTFLLKELGDRIEFTRKETLGSRYLRPLVPLLREGGEARRLYRAFIAGDRAVRPALLGKLSDMEALLAQVEAIDREIGGDLNSTTKLGLLRKNWDYLKREVELPETRAGDRLLAELGDEIRDLFSHVGNTSNLILDPDLDTYYLMDAILLKLPEGQRLLLRAGFEGEEILARKTLSPQEREQFLVLTGLIRSNLKASRDGAGVAFQNNPSKTLQPRLEKAYDDFVGLVNAYLDTLDREIVNARPLQMTPPALVLATGRPLVANQDLWNKVVVELDELMTARIQRAEDRRRIAWISTALVLALVAYLMVGFYSAVMRTVHDLEEASQRMQGEDPGAPIALQTKDELGRVTQSFNAIAQRLRREWEQAHEENARARAAEARLLESEERTRLIVQSALDAAVAIDGGGVIVDWNPQAAAIFGWSREEALGRRLSELIVPQAHRPAHEAGLRKFAQTGEGPVLNKRIEIAALRRDGAEFPIELSITPIRSPRGTTFSAFVRDITERKQAERELKEAKEEAEAANTAKSEFLASMSHELRTPLNSVIGFSTVLLKGKGKTLSAQEAAYLERILDNGKHLLGLINSILDLSKVEAGKIELNVVEVDLGALVRETIAQLEGRTVDKDVRLRAEVPDPVAPFRTDPEKLKQVLINLVGNALKFTEHGSVTVRVVAEGPHARPVRIEVQDTGVGIPKEMHGRIFEAFQQADTGKARKYEGTGLGLTISRSLCTLMGYRIDVASEVGKGSTFSILLGTRETKSTTVRRPTREEPAAPPGALRDRLILVVDDEEDSRFLLRQYIADCGCRVAEATAGPEAVRIAKEIRPDLITLDLMMPGMDGFQTLRGLKADAALRDIPVVVVSIVGRENRGTIFGAADVLNKPVSKEEICSVIRRNVRPGKNRVLVVDDDEGARQMITAALEGEPVEVRTAENGQDALLKMEEFPPDVVVLDLVMPVMDGMGYLDAIRRTPRWSSLPVVVATSKDLTSGELRQLEASVTFVLRKGDELRADLQRVIRGMLDGKRRPAGERIRVRVRKMVADMVPGFLENRRQDVKLILEAVARGDFEPVRVAGHNMKGVGSSYGFEPITEIGRRLEDAAKERAADEIRRQAAALGDYLDRVDVVPE